MAVYIEYALLENFTLDFLLGFFALRYSGSKVTWRLPIAALLGSVSAVVYPLLTLSVPLTILYKVATGLLIPLVAAAKSPSKNARLCVLLFFAFSFFVAGGTFAFAAFFPVGEGEYYLANFPLSILVGICLALFCLLAETAAKIKRRRREEEFLVDCKLMAGAREIGAKGFIDTGNCARHGQSPVCFATPALFALLGGGKKWERAKIKTMAGEKEIVLVKIKKMRISQGGQTHIIDGVYIAMSPVLCGREYELILGAWALG